MAPVPKVKRKKREADVDAVEAEVQVEVETCQTRKARPQQQLPHQAERAML
jgi:hypothetical protein